MTLFQSRLDLQRFEEFFEFGLDRFLDRHSCICRDSRRDELHESLERQVLPLFAGPMLSFDLAASESYADLMAKARTGGLAIGNADGYIAATAAANGMLVPTRDTAPFEAVGVSVINPWEASSAERT